MSKREQIRVEYRTCPCHTRNAAEVQTRGKGITRHISRQPQLISSDALVLSEQVKNSFDADAQHVLIRVIGETDMDGSINSESGSISSETLVSLRAHAACLQQAPASQHLGDAKGHELSDPGCFVVA